MYSLIPPEYCAQVLMQAVVFQSDYGIFAVGDIEAGKGNKLVYVCKIKYLKAQQTAFLAAINKYKILWSWVHDSIQQNAPVCRNN